MAGPESHREPNEASVGHGVSVDRDTLEVVLRFDDATAALRVARALRAAAVVQNQASAYEGHLAATLERALNMRDILSVADPGVA